VSSKEKVGSGGGGGKMAPRQPFGMFLVTVDPDSTFEKFLGVAAMAPYFIMYRIIAHHPVHTQKDPPNVTTC
jgi:hypothetical protein